MQRIAPHFAWQFRLLFLLLLPGFALAGNPVPEDYLASESLVLEVRYCECQANNTPSDVLPSFLKKSRLLKVGVSSEDKGFVSSNELSIGYELKPVAGSPDQFQFNYAGNYTASNGNSAGAGELLLVQGQWVNLFGSRHENESGSQHSNVLVRLAKPGGS
ncbi:hypothetical protein [Marinobacter sp. DY40_1A1]|uniref:hypothetical protein n=1 Tax=Marinobacter sp. DY40_1A1 TaxID=2583229 RepID=UPI00190759CE|nr:hypothetical protein [Marinobacter sp. DY40_1A1]MBK1887640.1 hypothetical protein [Marinobacter sp. DY40_1A1]